MPSTLIILFSHYDRLNISSNNENILGDNYFPVALFFCQYFGTSLGTVDSMIWGILDRSCKYSVPIPCSSNTFTIAFVQNKSKFYLLLIDTIQNRFSYSFQHSLNMYIQSISWKTKTVIQLFRWFCTNVLHLIRLTNVNK